MSWENGTPAATSAWDGCVPPASSTWAEGVPAADSDWARCQPIEPTLTSVAPASGNEDSTVPVVLTGDYFTYDSTVQVSGVGVTVQNVVVVNAERIECDFVIALGSAATERNVTVTTPGGTTGSQPFTVSAIPAPTLVSVSPTVGEAGTTVPVTLTGTNFRAEATVQVSGAGVTVQNLVVVNDTEITCDLAIAGGAMAGARTVTVTTDGGTSNAVTFAIETVVISDTYTPAGGLAENLQDHTPEIGGPVAKHPSYAGGGNMVVETVGWLTGRLTAPNAYLYTGATTGNDQRLRAKFRRRTANSNDIGFGGRWAAGSNSGILVWRNNTLARWEIYDLGGAGLLANYPHALILDQVYEIVAEIIGATVTVTLDGVPIMSATTGILTGTRAIVRSFAFVNDGPTTGMQLDEFEVTAL